MSEEIKGVEGFNSSKVLLELSIVFVDINIDTAFQFF